MTIEELEKRVEDLEKLVAMYDPLIKSQTKLLTELVQEIVSSPEGINLILNRLQK